MTTKLTFVIPVRHQDSVEDWNGVRDRLSSTLRSASAQTIDNWECVIVANHGALLPATPANCSVVRVDFPASRLPDARDDKERRWEAIRSDKGRRILAGLLAVRPNGYVMVVDYDDFVSRRLAAHVAQHPDANGWYIDAGYVFDGTRLLYALRRGFDRMCGTSLIVRASLLGLPMAIEEADEAWIRRTLGSHRFLRSDLEAQGHPLSRLPYPGAIYRVGHTDRASPSANIRKMFFSKRLLLRRPHRYAMRLTNLRPMTSKHRQEFLGGDPEQ